MFQGTATNDLQGDEQNQRIDCNGHPPSALAPPSQSLSLDPHLKARGAAERYVAGLIYSCAALVSSLHVSTKEEYTPIESAEDMEDSIAEEQSLAEKEAPSEKNVPFESALLFDPPQPLWQEAADTCHSLRKSSDPAVSHGAVQGAGHSESWKSSDPAVSHGSQVRGPTSLNSGSAHNGSMPLGTTSSIDDGRKKTDPDADNSAPSELRLGTWHCSGRGVHCRPATPSTRSSTPTATILPPGLRPNSAPAYYSRPSALRFRPAPSSTSGTDSTPKASSQLKPTLAASSSQVALPKKRIPKRPPTAPPGGSSSGHRARRGTLRRGFRRASGLSDRRRSSPFSRNDDDSEEELLDGDLQRWCDNLRFLSRDNRLDLSCRMTRSDIQELSHFRTASYYQRPRKVVKGVRGVKELKGLRDQMEKIVEPVKPVKKQETFHHEVRRTLINFQDLEDAEQFAKRYTAAKTSKFQDDLVASFGPLSMKIRSDQQSEEEEEQIKRIQKTSSMKRGTVLLVKKVFDEYDNMGEKGMQRDEFEGAVTKLLRIHLHERMITDDEVAALCQRYWQGKNEQDSVDFVEFAKGYTNLMKEQGIMSESAKLHACAVQHGVSITYAAQIKSCFEACQDDCLKVNFERFVHVLHRILKVQAGTEIPSAFTNNFWNHLDVEKLGKVDFEQFFAWWLMHFFNGDEAEEPDMELFYRHIRCLRVFIPDPPVPSAEPVSDKSESAFTTIATIGEEE